MEARDEIEILNDKTNIRDSIEFKIYFEKTYGIQNFKEFTKSIHIINSKTDELDLLFKLEFNRWRHILNESVARVKADVLNSKLNLKQFYSFIFYAEFNPLRFNDAKFIFELYDLNKDFVIDFNEFLESLKS